MVAARYEFALWVEGEQRRPLDRSPAGLVAARGGRFFRQ